ncbi:MAG TPA: hypothetical protein VNN62_02420 [Methylomirabilota bacterium]|jgi:hypothetical protein|nr:hypothetical protein [Methylomirabilota bacterium]
MVEKVTIDWGEADKAPAKRKKWLGAWLVSRDGEEGECFYDGPGGVETTHDAPAEAVGVRLRWWPPDDQVDLNLEFGPLTMMADDYFFPAEASGAITVAALSLVREKAA